MAMYLVRHGQTDWNLQRRLQASTDIPLNATGRAQAGHLREAFRARGVSFALGRCSPLGRARETIEIVLSGTSTPWSVEPALTEIDLGDFEGEHESELCARLGTAYAGWRARCFKDAAPNGESLEEAMRRLRPVISALAGADGGDLILVGHQGIHMALKACLSGREDVDSLRDFAQANDEVDIWDPASGSRIDRFRVSPLASGSESPVQD